MHFSLPPCCWSCKICWWKRGWRVDAASYWDRSPAAPLWMLDGAGTVAARDLMPAHLNCCWTWRGGCSRFVNDLCSSCNIYLFCTRLNFGEFIEDAWLKGLKLFSLGAASLAPLGFHILTVFIVTAHHTPPKSAVPFSSSMATDLFAAEINTIIP